MLRRLAPSLRQNWLKDLLILIGSFSDNILNSHLVISIVFVFVLSFLSLLPLAGRQVACCIAGWLFSCRHYSPESYTLFLSRTTVCPSPRTLWSLTCPAWSARLSFSACFNGYQPMVQPNPTYQIYHHSQPAWVPPYQMYQCGEQTNMQ